MRWLLWWPFAAAQTAWQQQLLSEVRATAQVRSKAARHELLERLERSDVRKTLAACCVELAQLPAELLLEKMKAEMMASEVVSGFSSEVNRSFFSFSLLEAEEVSSYENLWEIWVRNEAAPNSYAKGLDWLEVNYFGMKPFKEHAKPSMKEAHERSSYFMLNSMHLDVGSPIYGDISLVLKPSFAHEFSAAWL